MQKINDTEIFTWFKLINPTSTRPRQDEKQFTKLDVTTYGFTKLKTLTYSLSPYSLLNLRLNLLLLNNCYPLLIHDPQGTSQSDQ